VATTSLIDLVKEQKMRRIVLVATCLVVLATVVPAATISASAQGDLFRGTWTSVDTDSSHQSLRIQASGERGRHAMFLFDDSATAACSGSPASFKGVGVADGNLLLMRGTLTCRPGGNPIGGRISLEFEYDPGTDTISDETGVIWHRS
jgi:hypothetical protein